MSSPERSGWTCDESGRSNSSEAFVGLVAAVESLIRGEAASLIAGRADTVAGLIVAQLAHAHGLIPEENTEGLLDAIERLNATIERQEKELADLRAIASLDPDALRDAEAENDRLRSQLEGCEERLRRATSFAVNLEDDIHDWIAVTLTCLAGEGPHRPPHDTWAVRRLSYCLDCDGDWILEPIPSSRDEAFYARTRWPLDEALRRASEALTALREGRDE